jgi:hypothetical protein
VLLLRKQDCCPSYGLHRVRYFLEDHRNLRERTEDTVSSNRERKGLVVGAPVSFRADYSMSSVAIRASDVGEDSSHAFSGHFEMHNTSDTHCTQNHQNKHKNEL